MFQLTQMPDNKDRHHGSFGQSLQLFDVAIFSTFYDNKLDGQTEFLD
jgi:hypothetical protein